MTKLIERQKARAARGAKFLDRVMPAWWRRIRLGRLRIANGCHCVLGQLGNASFTDDEEKVGLAGRSPLYETSLGFIVSNDAWNDERARDALDEAWRDEIRERARAAKTS